MTIVRVCDLRAVSYCVSGTRAWFSKHGLDWSEFVRQGLPAEQFLRTGDGMAAELVKTAEKREAARNG